MAEKFAATGYNLVIQSFNVRFQKIEGFYPVGAKQIRNGLAIKLDAFNEPAVIFHAKGLNDSVQRLQQRAGAGKVVAAKSPLAGTAGDGFGNDDFTVIKVARGRAALDVRLDDRQGAAEFSGQRQVGIADATEVDDGKIVPQPGIKVFHRLFFSSSVSR